MARRPGLALIRSWPAPDPLGVALDVRETLSGLAIWGSAPWIRTEPGGGWFAARTPDGPATVRVTSVDGQIHAEAWGPGEALLLEEVPAWLGFDDDPSALVPHHRIVHELARRQRGVRIGRTRRVFPALVATVLAQKVTGKESDSQMRRLTRAWGERAPGPRDDLWLAPEPARISEQPYARFHPLGIERRRAELLIEVSRRAGRLEQAATMTATDAYRRLTAMRGIGPWTAGIVLAQALGDPDAVPVGDYHLPNVVAFNLAGEPRADDARMLELLEPYVGQRGRVVRLLVTGGEGAPKWGPRSDTRDIRGL